MTCVYVFGVCAYFFNASYVGWQQFCYNKPDEIQASVFFRHKEKWVSVTVGSWVADYFKLQENYLQVYVYVLFPKLENF